MRKIKTGSAGEHVGRGGEVSLASALAGPRCKSSGGILPAPGERGGRVVRPPSLDPGARHRLDAAGRPAQVALPKFTWFELCTGFCRTTSLTPFLPRKFGGERRRGGAWQRFLAFFPPIAQQK